MKSNNFFLALFFIAASFLTACNKDDDKDGNGGGGAGSASVIGNWEANEIIGIVHPGKANEDTMVHITGASLIGMTLELKSDNKVTMTFKDEEGEEDGVNNGEYSLKPNNTIELKMYDDETGEIDDVVVCKYTVSQTSLTLQLEDEDEDGYPTLEIIKYSRK